MKVFFRGNALYTTLKVSSTSSTWFKEYPFCIIDTGAFNTGIPLSDIISDSKTPNLKYSAPHGASGLGFNGDLDMYEATLLVGEEDTYSDTVIVGLPMRWPILGREIISRYKWKIDWKTQEVEVTENP